MPLKLATQKSSRYFRFLGEGAAGDTDDLVSLDLLYRVRRDYLGPMAEATWQILSLSECPAIANHWLGEREELIRLEGLAADGSTLAPHLWTTLRKGVGVQNHHFCSTLHGEQPPSTVPRRLCPNTQAPNKSTPSRGKR